MTTSLALGNARLLELAQILDTADERHRERGEPTYDQQAFTHQCGSPACSLGEWAAANPESWRFSEGVPVGIEHGSRWIQCYIDFAIDENHYAELFGPFGCRNAQTSKDAAAYIRSFVARRSAS